MRLGTPFFGVLVACSCLCFSRADTVSEDATPMGQVKKMLADLKKRVEDEGTIESGNYQKFTRWCDLEAQQCKSDIKNAEGKAEEAQADLNEAVAMQSKQEFQIEKLSMVISHKESDLQGAMDRRKGDHGEFLDVHAKLQESIDTFERALQILNQKATPAALAQVAQMVSGVLRRSAVVSGAPSDRMQAFFQQVSDSGASKGSFLQQPSAPVYESRSNQVLQIVAEMRDEVKVSQKKCEDEETAEAHAFSMLEQSMKAEIASVNKEMENAKQALNAMKERQAQLTQEMNDANNMKGERETYLTDIGTQCDDKSREFTERNKARLEEMNAISEAIKVLSSDRADELQKREPGHGQAADFFAQLAPPAAPQDGGGLSMNAAGNLQVGQGFGAGGFLQISQLTNRVVGMIRADPFGKVKKMIEGMVEKLLQEQAEAQEHKAWCDEETAKTKKSLATHTRNKDKFQSRIDEMSARSAMLKQEIVDTTTGIANLKEAFAQAAGVRKSEHDTAVVALKDYKDAQMMLQKALQVLSDFYRKQRAASAALLQQSASGAAAPPQTFAGGNVGEGRKDAAEGVLSILEIALSDFTRLESETTTEEDTAQKAFETFTFENKQAIALAETDVRHYTEEVSKLERDLMAANKDLSETTTELDATQEYMADLTKNCDWSGPTYEEQQQRRAAELGSLQNALLIISGEAIA